MSRRIPLLLLKWRQGARLRFISQTALAIKTIVPDFPRFSPLNQLLAINLLGAGSIAIFFELGVSSLQPAQAALPEQQATHWEQTRAAEPIDLAESLEQEGISSSAEAPEKLGDSLGTTEQSHTLQENPKGRESSDLLQEEALVQPSSAEVTTTSSPQLPIAPSLVVLPSSTSVTKEPSVTPASPLPAVGFSTKAEVASKIRRPMAPPVLVATVGDSNLGSEPLSAVTQSSCTTDTTCSHTVPSAMPMEPPSSSNPAIAQLPYSVQAPPTPWMAPTPSSVGANHSNPTLGQVPYFPQTPPLGSVPTMVPPMGANSYTPTGGQSPYYPQPVLLVPMPATAMPMGANSYNPTGGQSPYYPQAVLLVPMPATAMPMGANSYNPTGGQTPYYPQAVLLVPMPATAMPMGANNYNPTGGQYPYWQQSAPPLPAPLTPNPVGFNNYNPSGGQYPYWQQSAPPLPAPPTPNSVGFNNYNPSGGQYPYWQQSAPPLPAPLTPNPVGFNNSNPSGGQYPYWQQSAPPLPAPPTPNSVSFNNYNPTGGQYPYSSPTQPLQPNAPNPNLTPPAPTPTTQLGEVSPPQQPSLTRSTALTSPSLQLQGVYINQGDQSSARARLSGIYPLNPQTLFGATLDLTSEANGFADSPGQGLNINELYLATAPLANLPNLRLVVGQLDLTSYFDRNSFAKDAARDFFNSVFQTNPALSTTGISSRPGFLVNWTLTDNIEAKAAVFSSARNLGDFSLDGFAGEIGIRHGNAIIRGTYASARDAGSRDGFREIFQFPRGMDRFGLLPSDREESYGVNAEVFVPQLNMGIFGRYGRYENRAVALGGDTYSVGLSLLDLFTQNDRLGLAYGRRLSNDQLRRESGDEVPDVLELFYDFRFLPNLRIGFTLQERNGFSETYGGFRVKTEFDVTPRGRLAP